MPTPRPGGHPCRNAHNALVDAGYEPEVVRSYGWGALPSALNFTGGRRAARKLSGDKWLPVLVTDDDEVVSGSQAIVEWAAANMVADAG
jgi:hypothetical protein